MTTKIQAPYPNHKVTTELPDPDFNDSRTPESTVQIKRTMTGRVITHPKTSTRQTLTLPIIMTRMKSLELEAFIQSYQAAHWHVTLYDGSQWDAQLVGQPVVRVATDRQGSRVDTGKEMVEVTLRLSAVRLN